MWTLIYWRAACGSSLADRPLMRGAVPGAAQELCMDLEDEIIFRCQSYAVLIKPAGDGLLLQCGPSLTTQALISPHSMSVFSFLFLPLLSLAPYSSLSWEKRKQSEACYWSWRLKQREQNYSTSIIIFLMKDPDASAATKTERAVQWDSSGKSKRIKKPGGCSLDALHQYECLRSTSHTTGAQATHRDFKANER